jgi:hypothetical protein
MPRVSQEHKLQDQGTTAKSGLTKELACVDGYEVRQLWACCCPDSCSLPAPCSITSIC